MNLTLKILFLPGQIVATPGAVKALMEEGCGTSDLLRRHLSGDWGELPEADRLENALAVTSELRILSSYVLPRTQVNVWVITEADRSATTLLLPEEY